MKYVRRTLGLLGVAALAVVATAAGVDDQAKTLDKSKKVQAKAGDVVQQQLPSYPLDKCVISGEPLGSMGEPIDMVQDGRLIRLCCKGCKKAVEKDPAAAIAKVDAAVIADQKKGYPLEVCVVSGEPLGSMGDPIDVVVGTRLVRICCKGCKKGVQKDSTALLAKIDEALIEKQLASYPMTTCVVSGEPLDAMGKPVDKLYGTTLVRFCCKGCVKKFDKQPREYVAKVRSAAKAAGKSAGKG